MLFFENFIALFVESSPYLLLGMLIAGVINQVVPKEWINKTLGNKGSVFTAAIIGAPLPLCSCSVIPVAMGIRRSGASKASTASFLVATPETGADSIAISYALMGPIMAIARPIAAIVSAIAAGLMIAAFGRESQLDPIPAFEKSCCHKKAVTSIGFWHQAWAVLTFGYGQLLRDFMIWLLIGLFFASLIQTLMPAGFLAQYGQGVLAMMVIVLVSIPMYICATASTPIAVGMLLAGITPGAALVFMLTGPATNIATLMVIKNELGKRELMLYLIAIVFTAILSGLTLDYIIDVMGWQLTLQHGQHGDMVNRFYQLCAIVLAILISYQMHLKYTKNWSLKSLKS
jgi:uncharacterized membrane protein YraQ (UPF0718 family)